MRFLLTDWKRGFTEPRFFLAMAISLGCVGISLCVTLQSGITDGYGLFTQSHSLILPFCAPLLCALPYSNMQMREADTGFDRLMALRCKHKSWLFRRFITNGFISGVTGVMGGATLLAVSLLWDTTACTTEIYQVLGLNFIFGVAFGSLSYGLCFVNTQRYIPLIAPQVGYLFAMYACPTLRLNQYFPPLAFAPWILPSMFDLTNMVTLLLGLTAVGFGLTVIGQVRKAVGV
ncbi:hypothetical protein RFF05_06350 [Bengtsoniella intestinalis]|uniref:hypothetical protein n=1 Tax=Bengtsoniella intestinalis TaxID=3073143 RepID=UPI00391F75C5